MGRGANSATLYLLPALISVGSALGAASPPYALPSMDANIEWQCVRACVCMSECVACQVVCLPTGCHQRKANTPAK